MPDRPAKVEPGTTPPANRAGAGPADLPAGGPTPPSGEARPQIGPPPVAPRRPVVVEAHGEQRRDDWAWLRDRDDPAVLALLRAENEYTEAATAHLATTSEALFAEMRARIVETDLGVPVRKGPWWYYGRTVEGSEYPIHCRLPVHGGGRDESEPPLPPTPAEGRAPRGGAAEGGAADGAPSADAGAPWPDEEVLLDENTLDGAEGYLDVVNVAVSPDHGLLVYGTDTTGDERFTLRVRALSGGDELDDRIEGTSYGVAWANDNATVFYTVPDDANRPYQLWRHRIGTPRHDDVLVFEEPDARFHLGVGRTKDDAFVLVELHSRVTSEIWAITADRPNGAPEVVEPRSQGIEYSVEHHTGTFLLLTNDAAENFRVVAAPVTAPAPRPWVEVIAHHPEVRIEGLEVFTRHLAVSERREAIPRIRVVALAASAPFAGELPGGYLVDSPETPSASWIGPNAEFDSSTLRYEYSSLVTPRSVFDLDLDDGSAVLRKRQPVLGGYDPSRYVTARLWATTPDGVRVPVSIVHRRDVTPDGEAPCLLYGYGSYEYCIDPVFSSLRLSLLDRGFVFALAHVRGGGELGRHWYEEGKLLNKPNTFSDFVACARQLIDDGWTSPQRLVARGGSAGGLLVGAVANQAPELFRAMVAEVPFVDCLNTMCDDTLPLTVIEWEEWGNPVDDAAVYRVMARYTPYENVTPVHYPDMLVTAGLEDPRVGYWEPAKWVQRLRAADSAATILLKTELDAGHAGPTGRYKAWRDEAFVLSFVLDAVGLAPTAPPQGR